MINDSKFARAEPSTQPQREFVRDDLSGIGDRNKRELPFKLVARDAVPKDDPLPSGTKVEFTNKDDATFRGVVASKSGSDYIVEVNDGESYLIPPGKLARIDEIDEVRNAMRRYASPHIEQLGEPDLSLLGRSVVRVAYRTKYPTDNELVKWAGEHYPDWELVDALRSGNEIGLIFEVQAQTDDWNKGLIKQAAEDVKPQGGDQQARGEPLSGEEIPGHGRVAPPQLGEPGGADKYAELHKAAEWILGRFNDNNPKFFAVPGDIEAAGDDDQRVLKLSFSLMRKQEDDSLNHLYMNRNGALVPEEKASEGMQPVQGFVQVTAEADMPMLMIEGPEGPESIQEYGFKFSAQKDACMATADDVLAFHGGYSVEAQSEFEARLTKLAVDPKSKKYWKSYFKEYGESLTRDVPREMKKKKAQTGNRLRIIKEFFNKDTAIWGGQKSLDDHDYEDDTGTIDISQVGRYWAFVGSRGNARGMGRGIFVDIIGTSDDEDEIRQLVVQWPVDDPILVIDSETGQILYDFNYEDFEDPNDPDEYLELPDDPWLHKTAQSDYQSIIREEGGKYCVRSEDNSDWSGGCYDLKAEAEKRLKQVEFFKHQGRLTCKEANVQPTTEILYSIVDAGTILTDRRDEIIRWAKTAVPRRAQTSPKRRRTRYTTPLSKGGPSLHDLRETAEWSVEQSKHDPAMYDAIHKIVYQFLTKHPRFLRSQLGTDTLTPRSVGHVLVYALRESGRAFKKFRKAINKWQKRWERGQWKALEQQRKDEKGQAPVGAPAEPSEEGAEGQEPPAPGSTLQEQESHVPEFPGDLDQPAETEEDSEPTIELEESDIEYVPDEELEEMIEYDVSLEGLIEPEEVISPIEEEPEAEEPEPEEEPEAEEPEPEEEPEAEEPEIEAPEAESPDSIYEWKIPEGQFKNKTIPQILEALGKMKDERKQRMKRREFMNYMLVSAAPIWLAYIEEEAPESLEKWEQEIERRKKEAMKRRAAAAPGPVSHNAPGKDDHDDYDNKRMRSQPSRHRMKFSMNRMYSTSSSDDNGYIFMEMSWDPEIMADLGTKNLQHQIVSHVKGLESDKYFHDFGIMGKPKIVDMDKDAGVARVKVRCSETRGVMTLSYGTDLDKSDPVSLKGIR